MIILQLSCSLQGRSWRIPCPAHFLIPQKLLTALRRIPRTAPPQMPLRSQNGSPPFSNTTGSNPSLTGYWCGGAATVAAQTERTAWAQRSELCTIHQACVQRLRAQHYVPRFVQWSCSLLGETLQQRWLTAGISGRDQHQWEWAPPDTARQERESSASEGK